VIGVGTRKAWVEGGAVYDAYTRNAVRFVFFRFFCLVGFDFTFTLLRGASPRFASRWMPFSPLRSLSVGLSGLMAVKGGWGDGV